MSMALGMVATKGSSGSPPRWYSEIAMKRRPWRMLDRISWVSGSAGPCRVATTGVPTRRWTRTPMAREARPSWSWITSNSRACE